MGDARSRPAHWLAASLFALSSVPVGGQDTPAITIAPVPSTPIADGFTFAAVGDFIYLRPMLATLEARAPDMLKVLRGADVTFANFEQTVVHLPTFEGYPGAQSGGTWMLGDPRVIDDAVAMGIDIVSHANNHATDWGTEGLLETLQRLDAAGLVTAGTGRNLSAARAPRYFDGKAGRIALVAGSSTFTPMSRAGDPVGEVPGRPGVNPLRTEKIGIVSPADLAVLARVAGTRPGAPVKLNGVTYRAGAEARSPAEIEYVVDRRDEKANLLSVRQAKQNGNFAIYSLHNHEPGNASQTPARFAVDFAHKVIDAGADVFVGHGPHQLRGIEIYKGRPIFYSLGNFAMMNNSLDAVPGDMYDQYGVAPGSATTPELLAARNAVSFGDPNLFESVIAVSRFTGGRISEIRLYPIDLGVHAQGAMRGVPATANAVVGRRILERLQRLSQPFGTSIAIENGIGIIRIPAVQ